MLIKKIVLRLFILGAVLAANALLIHSVSLFVIKQYSKRFIYVDMEEALTSDFHKYYSVWTSTLWIIGIFLMVECMLLLLEKPTVLRVLVGISVAVMINYACFTYIPDEFFREPFTPLIVARDIKNNYGIILAAADIICFLMIVIQRLWAMPGLKKSLFLLSLTDHWQYAYYAYFGKVLVLLVAIKGIIPYLEILFNGTNYIADLIIILICVLSSIWFVFKLVGSIISHTSVLRKCKQIIKEDQTAFFLIPYKLGVCQRKDPYDSIEGNIRSNLANLGERNILCVSQGIYERYFRKYHDSMNNFRCIYLIFSHKDDFGTNALKTTEGRMDKLKEEMNRKTMSLNVFYGSPSVYEQYKDMYPGIYCSVFYNTDEDELFYNIVDQQVLRYIIDMCRNEAVYNSYLDILKSAEGSLASSRKDYLQWVLEELNQLHYEFDNVKAFYSMMKLMEFVIHMFFILNIVMLFNEEEQEKIISTNLENASIGSWYNFLCSIRSSILENQWLSEFWRRELEQPIIDDIVTLYGCVNMKRKLGKATMFDFIEFIIAFRNKTVGHGVISPYFISKEINTKMAGLLRYLIQFVSELDKSVVEFDGNLYLNHLGVGYDLVPFAIQEDNKLFLLSAAMNGIKEFLCYKDGTIFRESKIEIDLGLRM